MVNGYGRQRHLIPNPVLQLLKPGQRDTQDRYAADDDPGIRRRIVESRR
jgi:hypothetical protein